MSDANDYLNRFDKYSFREDAADYLDEMQYVAILTKLLHSVEKGLASNEFHPNSGKELFYRICGLLSDYASKFGANSEFYKTSLSILKKHIEVNKEHDADVQDLSVEFNKLPGLPNNLGGAYNEIKTDVPSHDYFELLESRHSVRHFSKEPVDVEKIKEAIKMARYTPSACNRQEWKSRIIVSDEIKDTILSNQNGNRGFGHEIDKFVLITFDLRCMNNSRELFQGFIDGGMYAMNVLNSLHYMGIATIPLSLSLFKHQDEAIRKSIGIEEYEEMILLIGIGSYPKEYKVTASVRREPEIPVI